MHTLKELCSKMFEQQKFHDACEYEHITMYIH